MILDNGKSKIYSSDDRNLKERMSANALLTTKKIGGWDQYGDRWISKLNNLNYE